MKSMFESVLPIQNEKWLVAFKDITKLTLGDIVIPVVLELDIVMLFLPGGKKKVDDFARFHLNYVPVNPKQFCRCSDLDFYLIFCVNEC